MTLSCFKLFNELLEQRSSARFSDTRYICENQFYVYTLAMKHLEIKKTSSFTVVSKGVKYLGVNLTKEM